MRANVQTPYSEPYVWAVVEWLASSLTGIPTLMIGSVFRYEALRRCEPPKLPSYAFAWIEAVVEKKLGVKPIRCKTCRAFGPGVYQSASRTR